MIDRMETLNSLERGEITVDKAVSLLRKSSGENRRLYLKTKSVRKGHWFKIRIKGDGHNIRLYAPISMLSFGFSMSKFFMSSKFIKDNDGVQTVQNVLASIDRKDMKSLVRAIKENGKTDIVQVKDGDTYVLISIV